jgi:hypothetical protein
MRLPWSKNECKHLVKYQGTNIEVAGISIPNIFSLGNLSIKSQVLQAAENTIKLLDLRHFQNCENLKQISDEKTKTTFIENMNKQQDKLSNIAMAIDAYKINPNSQKLEESLTRLLESDLPLPDSDKAGVKKILKVDVSQKDIKTKGDVEGGEVKTGGVQEGEFNASQQNIETEGAIKGSKVEIN